MPAKMPRAILPLLCSLLLLLIPQIALAEVRSEFTFGPTWKQLVGWGFVGLVGWVAVFFLGRFIYGVLLDARWSVDFALPLVITSVVVTCAAIAAAVGLFLYQWPQPWTQYIGYGFLATYVLVLVVALVGRKH